MANSDVGDVEVGQALVALAALVDTRGWEGAAEWMREGADTDDADADVDGDADTSANRRADGRRILAPEPADGDAWSTPSLSPDN